MRNLGRGIVRRAPNFFLPGDVLIAEGAGLVVAGDQTVLLVERSGILPVGDGTEPSVAFDVAGAVQPGLSGRHEGRDLGGVALLVRAGVILTSPLGDPDRQVGVPAVNTFRGLDEVLGIGAVPMEAEEVDRASITLGDEVIQPLQTGRRAGDGGGTVASVDGFNTLPPQRNGIPDAHISLASLIGLVEGENVSPRFSNDLAVPVTKLLATPEHRDTLGAVAAGAASPGAPGVAPSNFSSCQEGLHVGHISIGPSQTGLSSSRSWFAGRDSSAAAAVRFAGGGWGLGARCLGGWRSGSRRVRRGSERRGLGCASSLLGGGAFAALGDGGRDVMSTGLLMFEVSSTDGFAGFSRSNEKRGSCNTG